MNNKVVVLEGNLRLPTLPEEDILVGNRSLEQAIPLDFDYEKVRVTVELLKE